MSKSIKDMSKGNVTTSEDKPGVDLYKLSCLMRIADASEAMASNYKRMQADKEMYERWYQQEVDKNKKLEAKNASLRGVITRMKNIQSKPKSI